MYYYVNINYLYIVYVIKGFKICFSIDILYARRAAPDVN